MTNVQERSRDRHGRFADEMKTRKPGTLPEQNDPIQDMIETVYPDREQALDAALYCTRYAGPVAIHRVDDGFGLEADGDAGVMDTVYVERRKDGTIDTAGAEFSGDRPEEYIIGEDTGEWSRLQPVRDYMDGKTDSVEVCEMSVCEYTDGDEDDPGEPSQLVAICADRVSKLQYLPAQCFGTSEPAMDASTTVWNETIVNPRLSVWTDDRQDPSMIFIQKPGETGERTRINMSKDGRISYTRMRVGDDGEWHDRDTVNASHSDSGENDRIIRQAFAEFN